MKILVDASDLCTNRADGTTQYTKELLRRLPGLDRSLAWTALGPCGQPPSGVPPHIQWKGSPWPLYWTQSRMVWDVWREQGDVLFMPIQQLPIFRPWRMRTVAVIHDLSFHFFPEQTAYKDWLLLQTFTAQVAREADDIIAISQATADDVARVYGRTERVHVIAHGVDLERFGGVKERAGATLREKYPVTQKPYILFVGQIQPRKNLVCLIEAFERMEKEEDLQLVIGGSHGWLQNSIVEAAQRSPLRERIHMVGRIPDELLPALYAQAEVFVLPSLYEGFGMPILEAMAAGCPVVTSDVSSMPEIAGEAAILIDPESVESMAGGMAEARRDRDDLRERGLARVKQFSWETTAARTLRVIMGE